MNKVTDSHFTAQIESQKALIESEALFEIVQGVRQTPDLYELLKLMHHSLKKVLYAENCFFALYDANTGLFNFPYFVDQSFTEVKVTRLGIEPRTYSLEGCCSIH